MKLVDIYEQALTATPDKTAIICDDQSCTYRELHENILKYSAALDAVGIKNGDRVGMLMPNCLEIVYIYFACFRLGAVAVPSSYYSKTPEIIYEANHCKTKIYLVHHQLATVLCGVAERVPSLEAIYVIGTEHESSRQCQHIDQPLTKPDNSSLAENVFSLFNNVITKYGNRELKIAQVADDMPAAVFYTSGSTGKPKGVTHTHASFYHAAKNRCITLGHTTEDKFITTSYLCHGAATTILLLPMLCAGGTAVCLSHFSPDYFLKLLLRYQINFTAASPAQWQEIIDYINNCDRTLSKNDFSFMKYATSGGSLVPTHLQKELEELTGIPLTASLGMTECGGYMTLAPEDKKIPGSIGKPIHNTEVCLINNQGEAVAIGEQGEIMVKSNSIMIGYWNDPTNSKAAFTAGWFHTGDIGMQDKAGYFYFCGRLKETIIVDTGNVTPGEVEEVLNNHPAIRQSIIVGVPDKDTEQAVFAYIQLQNGSQQPTEADLHEYAAANLADRKVPKYWSFIKEFPVSGILAKIDRKKLASDALKSIN